MNAFGPPRLLSADTIVSIACRSFSTPRAELSNAVWITASAACDLGHELVR